MTYKEIFLTVVSLFGLFYVIGIYQYRKEQNTKKKQDEDQEKR